MYSFKAFKYFTLSASKTLTMKKYAKIKELLQAFRSILQSLLTVSYLGAYRYYTLEPIKKIRNGNSRGELMKELIHFRQIKNEELSFVTKAVSQHFLNSSISQFEGNSLTQLVQGYLIRSSGHRCLLVAYHEHDRVGCQNALELEFFYVDLLTHRLRSHPTARALAKQRRGRLR